LIFLKFSTPGDFLTTKKVKGKEKKKDVGTFLHDLIQKKKLAYAPSPPHL
jgi:hypothetical protein